GLSVEAELKSQVLEQLTYRSFQLFDSQEEIEKVFYLAIKVRESYYLSTKNNKRKMALESIWLKELLAKENPNALLYVVKYGLKETFLTLLVENKIIDLEKGKTLKENNADLRNYYALIGKSMTQYRQMHSKKEKDPLKKEDPLLNSIKD